MMSSRSIASTARQFAVALVALIASVTTLVVAPGVADAKKLVILEFEGPKAEKFRADVEAALKKSHTIVALDKWLAKAEDLEAEKVTARNVKKVATKLKVDGVIQGDVEKRGSRYYVHIKLRDGSSGDYVAEVEIVVRQPKLGADGAAVIKDELLPAIKELRGRGGRDDDDDEGDEDDDEDAPKKTKKTKKSKKSKQDDDDDEGDDDGGTRKSGFGRKSRGDDDEGDDDDEDDAPKKTKKTKQTKKTKKAKKPEPEPEPEEEDDEPEDDEDGGDDDDRVAAADDEDGDDDGDGVEARFDGAASGAIDPNAPAIELSAGLSVVQRKLSFTTAEGAGPVQGYSGNPVAGAVIDARVFPLALNKKNRSFTRNLGVAVLFDRVVKIESRLTYDNMGTPETLSLATRQQRYAAGVVYRHPISDQLTVTGQLRYNRMKFVIDRDGVPAGVEVQIPSVNYTFVDPGVAVRYASSPKLAFGAGVAFLVVLDTGELQQAEAYGNAKVTAFDLDGGVDYLVAPRIVVGAQLRFTTFGLSFDGTGELSDPDGDGTADVPGGRDSYLGGAVTASYLF